jgi:hypothetical protein
VWGGDHIDFVDLAARDLEIEYDAQPSAKGGNDSDGSVHECGLRELSPPRRGERSAGDGSMQQCNWSSIDSG